MKKASQESALGDLIWRQRRLSANAIIRMVAGRDAIMVEGILTLWVEVVAGARGERKQLRSGWLSLCFGIRNFFPQLDWVP